MQVRRHRCEPPLFAFISPFTMLVSLSLAIHTNSMLTMRLGHGTAGLRYNHIHTFARYIHMNQVKTEEKRSKSRLKNFMNGLATYYDVSTLHMSLRYVCLFCTHAFMHTAAACIHYAPWQCNHHRHDAFKKFVNKRYYLISIILVADGRWLASLEQTF